MNSSRRRFVRDLVLAGAAFLACIAAGAGVAAVVPATPLLSKQPMLPVSHAAIVAGSPRDSTFKRAGVDLFGPAAASQLARVWQSTRGAGAPPGVTRHRLTVVHTGTFPGRAKTLAFVAASAAVLVTGGKPTGYNPRAQTRFAALGFHPSFGSDSYTERLPDAPAGAAPAKAASPRVTAVAINGEPNGTFTGAPDDTILITGSRLVTLDGPNGTVIIPTAIHASFGACAGFDAIVQAVDPDGTWVQAVAGPGSQIVVDKRLKPGELRVVTAGGASAPQAIAYDAQLEVDTYTIPVDLAGGVPAMPQNLLGVGFSNSRFAGERASRGPASYASGRDVVGRGIRLIDDAVYLGATATAASQIPIAWPYRGLLDVKNSAAVAGGPNGVDLTTAVDWTYAPASAIAYSIAMQIETPIGIRPVSSKAPAGSACGA